MAPRTSARRSDAKLPASKLRESTSSRAGGSSARQSLTSREGFVGGEILQGKRNRSQKKSYVVDSSDEDAAGDDEEDAPGEDDDMEDVDDAEGEIVVDDTMEVDAEGEEDDEALADEDAEGDEDDMDVSLPRVAPIIKVSHAPSKGSATTKGRQAANKAFGKAAPPAAESDDEELSDLDSDEEDEIQDTVKVGGGEELGDEDAEGEEDEDMDATGQPEEDEEEDEEEDDLGSGDETGSRGETPDLTKMTKRQRARFVEEGEGELMKLSDEVQAKKHFTAEELSMRRAEMARRRRNLSEKRNEEVKMETINKLLKKQAPKTSRKAHLGDETPDDANKANPVFVRWVSTKEGSQVAVPEEMLNGPVGGVFVPGGLKSGKMVEEVA